jgi:hypothetical protein
MLFDYKALFFASGHEATPPCSNLLRRSSYSPQQAGSPACRGLCVNG